MLSYMGDPVDPTTSPACCPWLMCPRPPTAVSGKMGRRDRTVAR